MACSRRGPLALTILLAAMLAALFTLLPGCSDPSGGAPQGLVRVDIPDDEGETHTFFLEPALDSESRLLGLSHRESIDEDGGMIFVFPSAKVQKFVMRHCPIPIDIVYIDRQGNVIAHHAMLPEEPQGENESDRDYDERLKRYSSRFATPLVIELKGGMIERLGIDEGDVVKVYGLSDLEKRAK